VFLGGVHESMRESDVLDVLRHQCQVDLARLPRIHRRPDLSFGFVPSVVMPTEEDARRLVRRARVSLRVPPHRWCRVPSTRAFYLEFKPFL